MAGSTSLGGGDLPIEDGYYFAEICGFINLKDEYIKISSSGKKIAELSDFDEPDLFIKRVILLEIILKLLPDWTAFIDNKIKDIIPLISDYWQEIMISYDLIKMPLSKEATKWWDDLKQSLSKIENDIQNSTGKMGEKLTIDFEKKRLINCKYEYLSNNVQWISIISDKYGYDVQSFFGIFNYLGNAPKNIIMIEVKSSQSDGCKFRFFLTRPEWEKAEKNETQYLFYFWKSVNSTKAEVKPDGPYIYSVNFIGQYIPIDKHRDSRWEKCRIIIDLEETKSESIDLF
jgi:hypothetical protein